MKAKFALLLSVALLACVLCGCGAQPSPAETTAAPVAETSVTAAPVDMHERELYADYLTNGGYDELLPDYDDPESDYEAEACLADVNGDGMRELLIHFTNKAMGGVRGFPAVTVLLGVRDGKVVRLGYAENPGGSGGGDYMFLKYDTVEKKHVLEYEEFVRDGMFYSSLSLHFFDVTQTDPQPKEYGLVGSGDVVFKAAHTLCCTTYAREGAYADDAKRVLGETKLCRKEDDHVIAYLYDDAYISEAAYDEIAARYVEPIDSAYNMQAVTLADPIPD